MADPHGYAGFASRVRFYAPARAQGPGRVLLTASDGATELARTSAFRLR